MHILVTGAAGFIGSSLSSLLLARGLQVTGLDNLNAYYDPVLKQDRLARLLSTDGFSFHKMDLADEESLMRLFANNSFSHVVNLAAQAGVRYSLEHPQSYISSNLVGFANLLECCRRHPVQHLLFASSSSVYGLNRDMPFSASRGADHPASLYAATKIANEAMAHSYSHLYGLPCTGLRFFTVYGPWGRPDMSPHIFTKAILSNEALPVFNHGQMRRDFTYIDDIVAGLARLLELAPKADKSWDPVRHDPASSSAPYRIYNIGNSQPVPLLDFIKAIEKATGRTAKLNFLPMQAGDVQETYADMQPLESLCGFSPSTPLNHGIQVFVDWYLDYYSASR